MTGDIVEGEAVYYRFYLSAGQQATVTMQPLDADQDLYIYNPSGEQRGVSGKSGISTEECTFTADASGYYYAIVFGYDAGRYTITLSI